FRVWNTQTWQLQRVVDRTPRPTISVAFSPDGLHFAVGGGKSWGSVQMFDTQTIQCAWTAGSTIAEIGCVAFAPNGLTLASADRSGLATLWDSESGKNVSEIQVSSHAGSQSEVPEIEQITVDSNSTKLFVRHIYHGRLSRWNLRTKTLEREELAPFGSF